MPPHTLVSAKNSAIAITDMLTNVEFTREASWRKNTIFSPRRYTGLTSCAAFSRNPESEKNSSTVPAHTNSVSIRKSVLFSENSPVRSSMEYE